MVNYPKSVFLAVSAAVVMACVSGYMSGFREGKAAGRAVQQSAFYERMLTDQTAIYREMLDNERNAHKKTLSLVGLVDEANAKLVMVCADKNAAGCVSTLSARSAK